MAQPSDFSVTDSDAEERHASSLLYNLKKAWNEAEKVKQSKFHSWLAKLQYLMKMMKQYDTNCSLRFLKSPNRL